MAWIDHTPDNPGPLCGKCDLPVERHRLSHAAEGDPCVKCGWPARQHRNSDYVSRVNQKKNLRPRAPVNRNANYLQRKEERKKERAQEKREATGTPLRETVYIGVDGEGKGRKEHRYVLLAAATVDSETSGARRAWWVKDENGLATERCLDFLLWLPKAHSKLFAYSFNYDLTMILRDLPDHLLYKLFRPELRQRTGGESKKGPIPVFWKGYRINLQGTKFTVSKGTRRTVVWDVFKFFQAKFVNALKDWKIGTKEELNEMQRMKDQRGDFDKLNMNEVRKYCIDECRKMAELAKKLITAHEDVGLKLRSYYGAGSSGAAMLTAMCIEEAMTPLPPELKGPASSAFFGGRFENSAIGQITGRVYNFDISSAYPYQIAFLPCLKHGKWEHTTKRKKIERATAACVHYRLGTMNTGIETWGPFPFRERSGNICYPIHSGGGWVWKDEYLVGERIFPHVEFVEAWIYNTSCNCQPFRQIPEYYRERLRIGKEGPGIVLKLGCNSCYGKLAQSIGRGTFQSWIWAGMITSGCRAQILEMLALHKDWANLLMIATDGIYTREDIKTPIPKNTNTGIIVDKDGKVWEKPLGGWERKKIDKGVFIARPGIYFPMDPTPEEIKDVRGRGIGKAVVLENWEAIVDAWDDMRGEGTIKVANVTRFCGAKTSITRQGRAGYEVYNRACGKKNLPSYGQWITRNVEMSLKPMPKRTRIVSDNTLELRQLNTGIMSTPYRRAVRSIEALELIRMKEEILEQPEADLTDWEGEIAE